MKQAKGDAAQLLAEANARIENTIREIKEAQAEKEKTRIARQKFEQFKTELEETPTVDDKISKKLKQINEPEKTETTKKRRKQSTTYRSHRFNERRLRSLERPKFCG